MAYDTAPGNSKITEVILTKFDNTKSLNIFPQVFEMHIHESIFSGFVRAELMIHDGIGLFYNFPITGEEFVTISIEVEGEQALTNIRDSFDRYFVIESIENIQFSDNGRHMIYKMNLISRLAYENEKTLVSHAYNNTSSEAAIKIFYEYLVEPTNITEFKNCNARFAKNLSYLKEETNPENETNESPETEETDKPDKASIRRVITDPLTERFLSEVLKESLLNIAAPFLDFFRPVDKKDRDRDLLFGADQTDDRKIWVIPNMRPIDAILWLSGFANSTETLRGINTKANGKYNNYVFFETLNGFFYTSIQKLIQIKKSVANEKEPYTYRSNVVNAGTNLRDDRRYKIIQSLRMNNRYKTLNKISGGFFENNYIQINLLDLELSSGENSETSAQQTSTATPATTITDNTTETGTAPATAPETTPATTETPEATSTTESESTQSYIGDLKEYYTELKAGQSSDRVLLGDKETNTKDYIALAKGRRTLPQYASDPENINRTRYAFNDLNVLDGEKYNYRIANHWGETVRNSSSMDEIDLTISLPGDISLNAGDVIYCVLPRVDGYTKKSSEEEVDEFIEGYFFITEATHSFQFGYYVTTLKINKDSYDLDIDDQEFKYDNDSSINNPPPSTEV